MLAIVTRRFLSPERLARKTRTRARHAVQYAPRVCTLVLFIGFVILSVKRDLTSRMSNRAISERAYSVACERQKICGDFPETTAF